ncbi:MAG: DUF4013 domain-containing protein [Chloroflexota bacterium]|jgi:hypothetical protein|nr:DUF4013 domain-containing protein [Chloroflexota bacterium]
MMNFGLAFSYVFKDENWFKKVAIPAVCSLIPVVGPWVVSGWAMKAAKNVIDGNEEHALPELEFGADLRRGFMIFVITLLYNLPVVILFGIMGAAFGFGAEADQGLMTILYIVGGCVGLIGVVFALLVSFMSVIGIANYLAKGEFGAAFKFKEIFAMLKKSFVSWLLVIVGQILALGIIAPLGTIACVIGVFLTMAYGFAVYAHLIGQAYNQSASPVVGEVETL